MMFMILNPEVQAKAQAEIDKVIGPNRLPELDDKKNLPYVRGVATETARRGPPVPICELFSRSKILLYIQLALGTPHALAQDDVYDGHVLPKGTWVMGNVWHMLHDPKSYPDPLTFNPERYNGDDTEMEKVWGPNFGFGRRLCPGRYFAENSIFLAVVTMLATCDIKCGLDANGNEVRPLVEYTGGSIW